MPYSFKKLTNFSMIIMTKKKTMVLHNKHTVSFVCSWTLFFALTWKPEFLIFIKIDTKYPFLSNKIIECPPFRKTHWKLERILVKTYCAQISHQTISNATFMSVFVETNKQSEKQTLVGSRINIFYIMFLFWFFIPSSFQRIFKFLS